MSGFVIVPLLYMCVIRLSDRCVTGIVSRGTSIYELFLQSITDYNYRTDQCRLLSCEATFLVNDYK